MDEECHTISPPLVDYEEFLLQLQSTIELAWTIHETPARPGRILSLNPFLVADSGKERDTGCIVD